jgi:hypothetical protein
LGHVRFAPESGQVADHLGMSALCQKRPSAPQQKTPLFDHLVGAAEQRKRARNPKRLGSFEVKYQLDLDGLLDRQISQVCHL